MITYWALRATQGRPMCGVEVRIVDDAGDPLPNDGKSVGELEVRGPWTFVDQVPRTSVGKYDKKAIRARHADGAYEVVEVRD
jgi:non-ribosomal peptide synthetase component E (peptide arylation enzyme)